MSESVIPASYEQWRNCIEVRCRIPLTPKYVRERLAELQDENHRKTRAFAELYGSDHLQQVIDWFRRAGDEMTKGRK